MARNPSGISHRSIETWWKIVRPRMRRLLADAKYRAKRQGIEFNLKAEDLRIPERCPALGITIRWDSKAPFDNKPSLDRLDNSKGYTRENTRVISLRANLLKKDATPEEIAGLHRYVEDDQS